MGDPITAKTSHVGVMVVGVYSREELTAGLHLVGGTLNRGLIELGRKALEDEALEGVIWAGNPLLEDGECIALAFKPGFARMSDSSLIAEEMFKIFGTGEWGSGGPRIMFVGPSEVLRILREHIQELGAPIALEVGL